MSNRDKIIKLIATILALLLAFGIISGIVGVIMFFVRSSNTHHNAETYVDEEYDEQVDDYEDEPDYEYEDDYDEDYDYEDDYEDDYDEDYEYNEYYKNKKDLKTTSFSNTFENVEGIYIANPVYEVEIVQGNVSKVTVDCENVLEDFTAKLKNNTLILSGQSEHYSWGEEGLSALFGMLEGKPNSSNRKITVTLPKNTELNKCDIKSGTGNVKLEDINTKKLYLTNGTGSLNAKRITANIAEIQCGTGSVNLDDVYFKVTSLETGTGSTNISGQLDGDTEIQSGMGSINLNLIGSADNYNFDIEKGLGSITVDNKTYSELQTNNPNADKEIEIHGGMGSITIDFQHSS